MMDKKVLKENIDQIAKENSESWSGSDRAEEYDTVICCLVRDIKDMLNTMPELQQEK